MAKRKMGPRRVILFLVNLASTALTVFTGLRENPVLVLLTGKYDNIRSRFIEGGINYDIMRDDQLKPGMLPNLTDVGQNFRFLTAPTRGPTNVGADRSTCRHVNSMNVTLMNNHYDDFWGKGPRRSNLFVFSISAPHCEVLNLQPQWVDNCKLQYGNVSACHRYILDNFEELQDNRPIQVGIEVDFGMVGSPFLKCLGRPERSFQYITDMVLMQKYWAGATYTLEIQTSECTAVPLLRNSDWKWGLFEVQSVGDTADVVVAVDTSGWFPWIASFLYGTVTLVLIATGIITVITQSKVVYYIPNRLRFLKEAKYLRFLLPFMGVATLASDEENSAVRFKGSLITASDRWINHWLYIALSILDAIVSVRMMYIVLTIGAWMLTMSANFENFVFTCAAITRTTWLMCFLHSLLRLTMKVIVRALRPFKMISATLRHKIEWYVDATTLFVSYKLYSIMLCLQLYLFYTFHGSISFMVQQIPFKRGVFGGLEQLTQFWGNEIICDMLVILLVLLSGGLLVGVVMLQTKFRYIANNRVIQKLQGRYLFVGWDVFFMAEILGIDPMNPNLVEDDVAVAHCSLGTLMQVMFQSGPSGLVHFAGDYLFEGGAFSREPVKFCFTAKKALAMGLVKGQGGVGVASTLPKTMNKHTVSASNRNLLQTQPTENLNENETEDQVDKLPFEHKSLFDRKLQIFAEGRYGRLLLVDGNEPGRFTKNETGQLEYTVRDALSYMGIPDIKHLL
ncbi:hypothetical protein BBJ28_00008269, partial [Nothophytophthora sp. Chile5]